MPLKKSGKAVNIAVSVGDAPGPPREAPPQVRVWVLLGYGAGDNAQLLRLAEALGWPFEAHRGYSALRSIGATMAGAGDRRLAPRRAAGALDQEAIGRAQPVGAPAACSGALALFRFGGDHAAIPPA